MRVLDQYFICLSLILYMAFLGSMFYEVVTDDGALNTTTTSAHRKADLTFNLNWNTIEKRNRLKQQKNLIRSSKGRVIAWLWPCPHMCFNSPIKFWTISAVKTNKKSHKKRSWIRINCEKTTHLDEKSLCILDTGSTASQRALLGLTLNLHKSPFQKC